MSDSHARLIRTVTVLNYINKRADSMQAGIDAGYTKAINEREEISASRDTSIRGMRFSTNTKHQSASSEGKSHRAIASSETPLQFSNRNFPQDAATVNNNETVWNNIVKNLQSSVKENDIQGDNDIVDSTTDNLYNCNNNTKKLSSIGEPFEDDFDDVVYQPASHRNFISPVLDFADLNVNSNHNDSSWLRNDIKKVHDYDYQHRHSAADVSAGRIIDNDCISNPIDRKSPNFQESFHHSNSNHSFIDNMSGIRRNSKSSPGIGIDMNGLMGNNSTNYQVVDNNNYWDLLNTDESLNINSETVADGSLNWLGSNSKSPSLHETISQKLPSPPPGLSGNLGVYHASNNSLFGGSSNSFFDGPRNDLRMEMHSLLQGTPPPGLVPQTGAFPPAGTSRDPSYDNLSSFLLDGMDDD